MSKFIQFISITLLTLFAINLYAEPKAPSELVQETAAVMMKENNIPGMAVLLYVDGKPQSYYFGYANKDKKTPINKNTIFEVGSVTKLMTSLLLAQEVDSAKLQLDDAITARMTSLPEQFSDISFKNLATHTAGLPFTTPSSVQTESQFYQYLSKWEPEERAGEQWNYSNFGMGMLGFALETITHKNFNQLYRQQILSPLGMQSIALTVPKRLQKNYAQGYDENGNPVKPASLGVFPAAYGVKMSANDMQRFLSAAIGLPGTPSRIFYPMRMTQAAYVQLPDKMQGLGWQIHPLTPESISNLLEEPNSELKPMQVVNILEKPTFDGNALIDKTGTTDGFRAYIALIPNKKSGIVILTNKIVPNTVIVNKAREILFKLAKIETTTKEADTETA